MKTNNQANLFTDLTPVEEELLSGGGFFGKAWGWFKKNWGSVAIGVGIAAMTIFGGQGQRSACVTTNDGKDDKICATY